MEVRVASIRREGGAVEGGRTLTRAVRMAAARWLLAKRTDGRLGSGLVTLGGRRWSSHSAAIMA